MTMLNQNNTKSDQSVGEIERGLGRERDNHLTG